MASMNPCRCGYYPDRNKCNCTENDVKKYLEKVSGNTGPNGFVRTHEPGFFYGNKK